MPTAGCANETKGLLTQKAASMKAAPPPAEGPAQTSAAMATKLSGTPHEINMSAWMPRRASAGVIQPHSQKLHSMDRLMTNRPVAESCALQPATWVIQGPAHRVWLATMPP